ncbi:MAG: murein L,D-transpeptidase catalytic domain family protein [Bacteroidales bacterium]
MIKKALTLVLGVLSLVIIGYSFKPSTTTPDSLSEIKSDSLISADQDAVIADSDSLLYSELNLQGQIPYSAFNQALTGYKLIDGKKKDLLTFIDFTKASTEERFFVIDLQKRKILYNTVVSHGRNSGANYATRFSNKNGSYQSSLGFYLTGGTYIGKNGYSMLLDGLEKGINDRARERAIVVHGAPYANPSVIKSSGRLGRSLGCPALPQSVSKEIIDVIKNGSVLYIYANDSDYLAKSAIIASKKVQQNG